MLDQINLTQLQSFSPVEIYRYFVANRQITFLKKLQNPSYVSPVFQNFKFTCIHRIFDRVSQFELKNVIYKDDQTPIEILKRIFLFNQFKTEFFWSMKKSNSIFDFYSFDFDSEHFLWSVNDFINQINRTNLSNTAQNFKLFTNAYVVPGKSEETKTETIHKRCLEFNLKTETIQRAIDNKDIECIFLTLKSISGIGDFLASQVCFDFLWHDSTEEWEPLYKLGVGAIRGATKLGLMTRENNNPNEGKEILIKAYDLACEYYPASTVEGVKLYPNIADIQSTLCEIDKFLRLTNPELQTSKSAPKTIKNVYNPRPAIDYMIPGHWVGCYEDLVRIN